MGIRFRCHHCEHELHVKDFQAGKRGRCPDCQGRFRIPTADAEHSLALDEQPVAAEQDPPSATATSEFSNTPESDAVGGEPAVMPSAPTVSPGAVSPEAVSPEAVSPVASSASEPRALAEMPDAVWYVRPTSGGQYGPAPSNTIYQWLGQQRIGRDALVWREGWPEWLLAADVFQDFFGPAAQSTEITPSPQTAPDGPQPPTKDTSPTGLNASQPTLAERNRANRLRRRRRNYMIMIAILAVVMLALLASLVVVLMMQQE